ncbi:hypothetical protein SAMN04490243_2556 [Robiginitalea myxolifaciens]|uniref:Uncharacterized protein n=1 Tax=Robiginitalea myxolifaciens TaxID=400055 RepID=A0A1I6HCP9_9FLAO|nr:DUF6090 family protein [Robiginitalea myxolifaciens]SFR52130.1 hypothetical protein SAMN04490243_2556 [Robiginitalea myxolifaciens]
MIKFFRKIRQQLIAENRVSKYLLYAIGEIILVVIGILIALSINNWNEKQKDLAQEQLILKQLRAEYQSNLAQLDEKVLMREEGIEACHQLLSYIDNPEEVTSDKLYDALWHLVLDPTFDPIKNDIVGSEKIRLIRNQELVRILSNWSSDVYQVQELELEFQKIRTEFTAPCLTRLGIARNVNNRVWQEGYSPIEALEKDRNLNYKFTMGPTQKTVDLQAVLFDVELEGLVSWTISFFENTNLQSQTLRSRIKQMLEILDQEIAD